MGRIDCEQAEAHNAELLSPRLGIRSRTSHSSYIAYSLHPFVHTYHGTEPRLFARAFHSLAAAVAFMDEQRLDAQSWEVVEL